jgi:hypothetical protein
MTNSNRQRSTEPFLTSVARRIGRAAGSFSKAAHDLTSKAETSTTRPAALSAGTGRRETRSPKKKAASLTPNARPTRHSVKKAAARVPQSKVGASKKTKGVGKKRTKKSPSLKK